MSIGALNASMSLCEGVQDINCSADTMKSTCKELDSQESLKGVIQSLRRCQAADEKRMHQVLTHIADLGVQTQTLDSPSSWRRRQTDDAGAAECKGMNLVLTAPGWLVQVCARNLQRHIWKFS